MTALWAPRDWLAALATAGKGVLTDSGKGGLLSGGKAALFDSGGDCSGCCDDECPATLEATVSGIDAALCCVVVGSGSGRIDAGFDGTFTLSRTGGTTGRCQYQYVYPTFTRRGHSDTGCATETGTVSETLFLNTFYDSATGVVDGMFISKTASTGIAIRVFEQFGTSTLDAAIANALACGYSISTGFRFANGGTITVSLP